MLTMFTMLSMLSMLAMVSGEAWQTTLARGAARIVVFEVIWHVGHVGQSFAQWPTWFRRGVLHQALHMLSGLRDGRGTPRVEGGC